MVWKLDTIEDDSETELDTSNEEEYEDNKEEETERDEAVASDRGTHTVNFKSIGATETPQSQEALKTVGQLLASGHHVPVDVFPEPHNP